ncbi:MAG TPA: EAL domain-containing protein, partial [Rheinheimera sp.]|nr:EAL domain-containing protein [Rheinheimera sp.]
RQLRAALPEDVIAARLRGVKFALWRPLPAHCTSLTAEAERLISFLPQQLLLSVGSISPVYEIGASVSNQQRFLSEQTLEQCESALEQADAYNRPLCFFQPDNLQQRNDELQLVSELKTALQHKTPELWLQPKVRPDGTIESFEALLRWQQPDGSYAAPDKVVALAEQYGIIVQLSSHVLHKAISIIQQLRRHRLTYPLAINLTGTDLLAADFYNELVNIATHQPELLKQLTLELTENSIAKHQQPLFDKLHALKKLGFMLALDDFGTGQASLSMLNKLPVDTVKLDKSFLQEVPANPRQTQLVQSVMLMTKALKLRLVIEGVETELQQRFLRSLGAEQLQGYWFSRPKPVSHWLQQLTEQLPAENSTV